jgi:hypothetical protein
MLHRRPSTLRLLAMLAVGSLALVALAPSALAQGRLAPGTTFTVTHGPVTMTLANPDSDGHQLGDVRVTSRSVADESGTDFGRIDAILTTTGIDVPNPGDEVRISTLVFSFGDGTDQLVVTGTGMYPKAGGTIATNSKVIRPVTGGSGIYAGATGWAETEHLADGTWRHTFHLESGRTPGMPVDPDASMGDGHMGDGHMDHGWMDRGHMGRGWMDRGQMASPAPAEPLPSAAP